MNMPETQKLLGMLKPEGPIHLIGHGAFLEFPILMRADLVTSADLVCRGEPRVRPVPKGDQTP